MNFLLDTKNNNLGNGLLKENEISPILNELLYESLFIPLEDFFKNPGKNIRSQLVELGFLLGNSNQVITKQHEEKLIIGHKIVESIHAGALIVDDIEDGSEVRRNAQTLHMKYGVPRALNAGNWLYFHGLSLIKEMGLSFEAQSELFQDCLDLMMKAHYGQAIDVGTKINEVKQENVRDVCLTSFEYKTGALMCMAMRIGWAISGRDSKAFQTIFPIGMKLGTSLQIYDDIGNFLLPRTKGPSKRQEDIHNKRPSWVWAVASEMESQLYQEFLDVVAELPNEQRLQNWIDHNVFEKKLIQSAQAHLNESLEYFEQNLKNENSQAKMILSELLGIVERAYVS